MSAAWAPKGGPHGGPRCPTSRAAMRAALWRPSGVPSTSVTRLTTRCINYLVIWISTWHLRTSFTFKSRCYVAICGFYVPSSSQKHLLGELYVSPLLYSRVLFLWLAIWRRISEFEWKNLSWTSDYSFAREALRNHEQRFGKWKTFIGDFPSFVRLFLESSNLFCME